jgi:hypothetical protein
LYVGKVYLSKLQSIRGEPSEYKTKTSRWYSMWCFKKYMACYGHVTRLAQNLPIEWEVVEVQWSIRMLRNVDVECNQIAPS